MTFSTVFKDHLANPRNAGELSDANAVAEETNPVCGDRLRLSLRIRNGRCPDLFIGAFASAAILHAAFRAGPAHAAKFKAGFIQMSA